MWAFHVGIGWFAVAAVAVVAKTIVSLRTHWHPSSYHCPHDPYECE
jgi:hypothetical protein